MESRINDIIKFEKELKEETESYLQLKADLSGKLSEMLAQESSLTERLASLKKSVSAGEVMKETDSIDIPQLIQTKIQLENEINEIQKEVNPLEQQLAHINTDRSIIDSKIDVLEAEKKEQENIASRVKQNDEKQRTNNKVQNEKEKLKKIKSRVEQQNTIKENLEIFLETLESIHQVISNYSPLSGSEISFPSNITEEIQEQIIETKKSFDEAQINFDPNNLVPFLVDADNSYKKIVSAFIRICDNIPNSLLEKEFSEQIFTLVDKGFMLNTRHLNAVQSMLSKLEKGVEIAPLASFANEIKNYFVENLTYLRVTGWVVLEPPPS